MAASDIVVTPELRAFEYALGLFSVLIGLAIADIASSVHRLIRNRDGVRWDPLAVLAALFALCTVVNMWFDLWGVRGFEETRHYFFYLSLVALLFVVFLIAAASLPDEPHGRVDLREFYDGNRRYFWGLVALYQLIYLVDGMYFIGGLANVARAPVMFAINMVLPLIPPLLMCFVRSRALNYAGIAAMFALMLWHYARYAIV